MKSGLSKLEEKELREMLAKLENLFERALGAIGPSAELQAMRVLIAKLKLRLNPPAETDLIKEGNDLIARLGDHEWVRLSLGVEPCPS